MFWKERVGSQVGLERSELIDETEVAHQPDDAAQFGVSHHERPKIAVVSKQMTTAPVS